MPNDFRGSWSDFVRSFDLYLTGAAALQNGRHSSPWVQHGWDAFVNQDEEIDRANRYDNGNPTRMGLAPQDWWFVKK